MPVTVPQLAARTLRKLGIAIVANVDRPGAGSAVSLATVAGNVLRELGVPVAEVDRPASLGALSQTELGARTLRALGVNQIAGTASGSVVDDVTISKQVLQGLGVNLIAGTASATTLNLQAIGRQVLQGLGVNPIAGLDSAVTVTKATLGKQVLQGLGVNPATASASGNIVTQATIAQQALLMLGVNPADPISGSGTTWTYQQIATAALRRLAVVDAQETPETADQTYAETRTLAVHDMLVSLQYATWDSAGIPDSVSEAMIALAANLIAPAYGRNWSADVAAAGLEMVRKLTLEGVAAQNRAVQRVTHVHEQLAAEGLADWGPTTIPDEAAEAYVSLVASKLAPIHGKQAAPEIEDTAKAQLRRIVLSGARGQALAEARVAQIHDEATADGLASWTVDTVPGAAADAYTELATQALGPVYGRPADEAKREAAWVRIRRVALSGSRAEALAEARVSQIHDELLADGIADWALSAVPQAAADAYTDLAMQALGPVYGRPINADAREMAWGRLRKIALSSARGQALAQARVAQIHDELLSEGLAGWTLSTIPAGAADAYSDLVMAALGPVYGRQISQEGREAAWARLRKIVLSGPRGQTLAEQAVAEVHEDLNALGLVAWPVSAVPVAHAADYVQMSSLRLAPAYGGKDAPEVVQAAVERMRIKARVRGLQDRAASRVQAVHEEINALGLVTWSTDAIPASVAAAYADMATALMQQEAGAKLDAAAYQANEARIRRIAMGGPAGQALAEQKVRAVHYDLEARGKTRWTLVDIPRFAEEPYVLMAATLLAPECDERADPAWAPTAQMMLAAAVSLPSTREPVRASYF